MVNGAEVIRYCEDIPPLRGGQTCEDCRASKKYRWEPVRIGKGDIHAALTQVYGGAAELGGVSEVRCASFTPYGRIVWVDVLGTRPGKSIRLRAEDLRLALLRAHVPAAAKLYSMNCRLRDVGPAIEFYDGKGYGHGVGLCQWGAEGKAQRNWSCEQILGAYYPGAKLLRAY